MKVSVITVVYNRVATIERAIQSVLRQSYSNIEYIVIDGASGDGTTQLLQQYKNEIDVLVSEKDKGMYDALNKGIRLATGDIVGILHADDEFADDTVIERVVQGLKSDASVEGVYGDVGFVRSDNSDTIVRYYSSAIFRSGLFTWGFMPAHPTFFCYRHFFEQFGYYRTDLQIAADFDLLLRFLRLHKIKTVYIPEMLVKMNLGGKSTGGIKSTIRINKELKQILRDHKLPSSYIRLYARYFIKVWEYRRRKI
ncbi:MAG: glycosyltransferase family 2 protein [Lacibacter sp.]